MSGRANGEGSVYRRKDGRWTAAHYVLKPDGGRVRRQVYGKTRAEAARALAELVATTGAGIPLAVPTWTVAAYGEHWITDVVTPRLRPATVLSYRETLRLHIIPSLGRLNLRRLTPAHVRRLLVGRAEAGLSPRSVQIVHATLRSMLAEAVRDELVEPNVAALVRAPSVRRAEVKPWTPVEASAFLHASSGHRLHALFAVGVALGLRKGELTALRWTDVDLDSRLLRVRQTGQRIRGVGMVVGPPKSPRSHRDIPLPSHLARVLRSHRASQEMERRARPCWQDSGLVFVSTAGTMLEPRNLTRLLDQLIAAAGVRRIRFHDLRHTCASLLLAQDVSPRVVMDVLGHSQFSITMDLYAHVMPSALRNAADAMDRLLGQ